MFNKSMVAKELLKISSLILGGRGWSWSNYGAWVLPDGKVLPVAVEFTHYDVAAEYFQKKDPKHFNNIYSLDQFFNEGWVRVVFRQSLSVEIKSRVYPAQREVLLKMVEDYPRRNFYIDDYPSSIVTEDAEEARDRIRAASLKKATEIKWSDYGAWILPDGKVLRVGYQEHMETAEEYFNKHKIEIETNPYVEAFKRDWVRVVFKEMGIEMGSNLTSKQRYVLEDMVDDNPYTSKVFFDRNGTTNINFSTDDKESAINKIRAAGLVNAASFHFTDYGAWILPTGGVLRVEDHQQHGAVASKYLAGKGIEVDSYNSYSEAFKEGLIRIQYGSDLNIEINSRITPRQRNTLLAMVDSFPKKTVMIDKDIYTTHSQTFALENKEDAKERIRSASMRVAKDWSFRDYGAWVLPNGDVLRVKGFFEHSEVAGSYMKFNDIVFKGSPYDKAYKMGWVRAVFLPDLNFDIQKGLTSQQRSVLTDMLDDYPKETVIISRPSREIQFDEKEKALNLLRVASLKKVG